MVLSFSVFPRKLTREARFIVLLRIWLPQRMKRLLKKPRRQKGIRGRKTAFDKVCPRSVASCDNSLIVMVGQIFLQKLWNLISHMIENTSCDLYLFYLINYSPLRPARELYSRDTQQEVEEDQSSKPDNLFGLKFSLSKCIHCKLHEYQLLGNYLGNTFSGIIIADTLWRNIDCLGTTGG